MKKISTGSRLSHCRYATTTSDFGNFVVWSSWLMLTCGVVLDGVGMVRYVSVMSADCLLVLLNSAGPQLLKAKGCGSCASVSCRPMLS